MTYYDEIKLMREKHSGAWDYYGIHSCDKVEDYFQDPCRFLQKTFEHAKKSRLIQTRDGLDQINTLSARAAHSVSALFLGAMAAIHFCDGRFLKFKTDLWQSDNNAYEFAYIWTLTSLYHDYGYSLEKNEQLGHKFQCNVTNQAEGSHFYKDGIRKQKNKVGHLLSELSIDKTLWREIKRQGVNRRGPIVQDEISELQHKLFLEYNSHPKYVYAGDDNQPIAFPTRTEEDIIRYAIFRLTSSHEREECVDHGIFGGYRFFDSMIKNYVDAYMHQKEMCPQTEFECFAYDEKRFCVDQLSLFAYIADCIMNHNIWRQKVDSEDGEICKTLGLYYVLGTNYERISLLKNPLLFILAFADSLEPYKLFCRDGIDSHKYNEQELFGIFNEVELTFQGNTLAMKAPVEMKDKLRQSIIIMEEWLAVRHYLKNNTFYISPILKE